MVLFESPYCGIMVKDSYETTFFLFKTRHVYNENVTYDAALLGIESMIEYTFSIKTKFDQQLGK